MTSPTIARYLPDHFPDGGAAIAVQLGATTEIWPAEFWTGVAKAILSAVPEEGRMGADILSQLRPHRFTRDEAGVMTTAGVLRNAVAEIERLRADLECEEKAHTLTLAEEDRLTRFIVRAHDACADPRRPRQHVGEILAAALSKKTAPTTPSEQAMRDWRPANHPPGPVTPPTPPGGPAVA